MNKRKSWCKVILNLPLTTRYCDNIWAYVLCHNRLFMRYVPAGLRGSSGITATRSDHSPSGWNTTYRTSTASPLYCKSRDLPKPQSQRSTVGNKKNKTRRPITDCRLWETSVTYAFLIHLSQSGTFPKGVKKRVF